MKDARETQQTFKSYSRFVWMDRHGQEFLVDPDSDSRRYNDGPTIAHHRIIAYAHGELESLLLPVEIDHQIEIPWLNYAANLEEAGPVDHGRRTRQREYERKNGTRTVWAGVAIGRRGIIPTAPIVNPRYSSTDCEELGICMSARRATFLSHRTKNRNNLYINLVRNPLYAIRPY